MRRQTLVPTSDNSFLEQHTFALFLKPFFLRTSDVVVVSLSASLARSSTFRCSSDGTTFKVECYIATGAAEA